jgi:hypothetical protein
VKDLIGLFLAKFSGTNPADVFEFEFVTFLLKSDQEMTKTMRDGAVPSLLQHPLLPEQGAQDESALMAEMSEWHDSIHDLLHDDAPTQKGIQEVHVGELASDLASWCKDAGSDAATSIAKKATAILPKSGPGGLRRKGAGASGWLSATLSSTMSLLTGSPGKGERGGLRRSVRDRDGLGERGERSRDPPGHRGAADGGLRRQRSDMGPASSGERLDRDLRVRRSKSDVDWCK